MDITNIVIAITQALGKSNIIIEGIFTTYPNYKTTRLRFLMINPTMAVPRSIGSTCNTLQEHIRASGLNFSCQETPFSLYITVRKSFTKIRTRNLNFNPHLYEVPVNPTFQNQIRDLLAEKKTLEKTLEITNQALESDTRERELREEVIEELVEEKKSKGELLTEALKLK